jgi:hypothetical protein
VRSALRRQPRIPAFGQAPQETREWAGNPGFSRIRFRLWAPRSPIPGWKSPKVSGLVREYSRFAETIAGDWFDHDCRLTVSGVLIAPFAATTALHRGGVYNSSVRRRTKPNASETGAF